MGIGGSKGGARDTRPPPRGPNSFIFMQFSAKIWKIIAIWDLAYPSGENPGSATDGDPEFLSPVYFVPFSQKKHANEETFAQRDTRP